MNDYELGGGDKVFAIPQYPETRQDLLMVDRQTKEDVRIRHRLYINSDWECNTITLTVLETLARVLHAHIKDNGVGILDKDYGNAIDFYGLLLVTASNRKNAKAEKNGNINIVFKKGIGVDAIVSDDTPKDVKDTEYVSMDAFCTDVNDEEFTQAMLKVDRMARKQLNDKNSILLPKNFMAITIARVFIDNLYRQLVQKAVLSDKSKVTINFNDIVEIHATKKDDGVIISLTPGMAGKLIIKYDGVTEREE